MAITYVNDLRLSEMDTGDNSGTWGTVTNTNLELIGEALGYGTEAITTNADTHASTIADGSTDPVRAMYVKYTGTLDSACTITIGPNTVNKFYYIENATSGSQNIIISQGSGANVTIPAGDVKAVYLDGAGSGAAVTDAFASLSVVDLNVSGDLDIDGTTNLDVTNIVGDLTVTADTVTFTSANANDPALKLINTANDTDGAELQIRKDKGAAGADGDIVGLISFIGDDAAQQQHIFAKMTASIVTAADGSEGGKLALGVASHDAEFQNGLVLQDGNAEDEIDVTIGSGTSSLTTISGDMAIPNGAIAVGQSSLSGGSVLADFHSSGSGVGTQLAFANDHNTDKFFVGLAGNTTGNAFLYQQKNANIEFYTNNDLKATLDNNGNFGIGGTPNVYSGYTSLTLNHATNGGIIDLELNGTVTGELFVDSNGLHLYAPTSDDTITFRGNDGGTGQFTALTLDMAAAGTATFNKKVIVSAADGVADADYVGSFANLEATAGRNFGFSVQAGTNSSDIALNVVNKAADTALLRVFGDGTTTIGNTLTLADGNLVVANGHGIDFAAQTPSSTGSTSSELLDHYEEGTWTPVVIGTSSSGSGTYSTQSATYTKIGRVVAFQFAMTWSNHTGSGSIGIGGFPFTSGSQTYFTIQLEAISLTSNNIAVAARIEAGETTGLLIESPVGGGNRAAIAMDTAGSINAGGTYEV